MPVERLDVLREAHAQGRGVILSFIHHGQSGGTGASIGRHGIKLHGLVDGWYLTQTSPSWAGIRGRQHIATVGSRGVELLVAERGAYAKMRDLLGAGEILAIASDLPGTTSVTFMGRPVKAASGAARLALETGAPIVPVTAWRGRPVQTLRIEDPLPVDSSMDVPTVLGQILSFHEVAVRAWPEALERPAKRFELVRPEDIERFGYPPGGYFQRYRI